MFLFTTYRKNLQNSTSSQRRAHLLPRKEEVVKITPSIERNCSLPTRGVSIKILGNWINREESRFSLTINYGIWETLSRLETHDLFIHSTSWQGHGTGKGFKVLIGAFWYCSIQCVPWIWAGHCTRAGDTNLHKKSSLASSGPLLMGLTDK